MDRVKLTIKVSEDGLKKLKEVMEKIDRAFIEFGKVVNSCCISATFARYYGATNERSTIKEDWKELEYLETFRTFREVIDDLSENIKKLERQKREAESTLIGFMRSRMNGRNLKIGEERLLINTKRLKKHFAHRVHRKVGNRRK